MDDDNDNDAFENNNGAEGDDTWGSESGDFWESEEGINKYFCVFFTLLSIVLVLSKFLHDRPKLASVLPEAIMVTPDTGRSHGVIMTGSLSCASSRSPPGSRNR